MKSWYLFLLGIILSKTLLAQPGSNPALNQKLDAAIRHFENLPEMRHASIALVVADAASGEMLYAHHPEMGLAAASVQKLVTSAAAFELLGSDFRFRTEIHYNDRSEGDQGAPGLCITGYGDPSLGSWRYAATRPELFFERIADSLRKYRLTVHAISIDDTRYPVDGIPRGWIWEDIGNYYGAGVWGVNWKENQFDLQLQPGRRMGSLAMAGRYNSDWLTGNLTASLTTAAAGTGDNAYLFQSLGANGPYLLGTVPAGAPLTISGAMQSPYRMLGRELAQWLDSAGLADAGLGKQAPVRIITAIPDTTVNVFGKDRLLFTQYSPALDSLNYFFLRKSINLYGEALVKAIAYRKTGLARTETGVEELRRFWQEKGIDPEALHIVDGSGLSPQNRVTARALVQVLQFARNRSWYASFYNALPVYNQMKMKSGSIGGARAFAGYQSAAGGKQYAFAIIVNNYSGSSAETVQALYAVLNALK